MHNICTLNWAYFMLLHEVVHNVMLLHCSCAQIKKNLHSNSGKQKWLEKWVRNSYIRFLVRKS